MDPICKIFGHKPTVGRLRRVGPDYRTICKRCHAVLSKPQGGAWEPNADGGDTTDYR